jgi:predicted Zn finger-like uncharacterized protein
MLTQCPYCKARFEVGAEHKGEKTKCSKCKQPFEIIEYIDLLTPNKTEIPPCHIDKRGRLISRYIPSTVVAILLGGISTIITILLVVVVVVFTGYHIHSFSLFFVIPIGGLFAGAFCGSGVLWGLHLTRRKPANLHRWASLTLGIIGFIGTYYGLYATTYVSSDMKINHKFEGLHISNFVYKDTGKEINFYSYLIDEVRNRQSTFIIGVGKSGKQIPIPIGSVGLGSVYNFIKFGLEGIGFILGSFFSSIVLAEVK